MGIIDSIFLLALLTGGTHAYVFSLQEVIYKLIGSDLSFPTRYACLYLEKGYSGLDSLKNIYAQADNQSISFVELANKTCVERKGTGAWRIVIDSALDIDGNQEFSLVFTSNTTEVYPTGYEVSAGHTIGFVNPRTGIWLNRVLFDGQCDSGGNLAIYAGAGSGESESRYLLKSWRCNDFPDWIVSFDNLLTVVPDYGVFYTLLSYGQEPTSGGIQANPGDRIAIISTGRSDNLANMNPDQNVFQILTKKNVTVDMKGTATFDYRYGGYVQIQGTRGTETWRQTFLNSSLGNFNGIETASNMKVQYSTIPVAAQDIWDSQDNFVIELTLSEIVTTTTTTPKPTTTMRPSTTTTHQLTTTKPILETDPYCGCDLDEKFGMPDGWDSTEIWIDVVIILDTSAAMARGFLDATTLIESLIGTDDGDVLITDPKAPFCTRVGLIAMSDEADVLYNLNMTKYDTIRDKVQVNTGVSQINIMDAFYAAQNMLNDGQKGSTDRSNVRQVIYYITDSDPKTDLGGVEQFKASDGIVIVNNFLEKGQVERPGLKELASPGYYYTDIQKNYMSTIQLFCKANCYCRTETGQEPYAGTNSDIAVEASGGCLRVSPVGVPFSKARTNCASIGGGLIASIHDSNKAAFVQQLMHEAASKSDYYWIGYSKSDAGWSWEDQSTNPYTNWDKDEPNSASVAKCAYVDTTSASLPWAAGNCNVGFPFVCEFAPCAVGNKNC